MYYIRVNILLLFVLAVSTLIVGCEKEGKPVDPYKSIHGFVISETGEKFLATSDGLYFFNVGNGSIELVGNDTPAPPIYDLNYANNASDLWLASHNGAFNYSTQEYLVAANSELPSDEVNHIHFDRENTSYFATPEGLSLLSNQDWLMYYGLDELFLDFEITDIASATNGYTYVTTFGGGIERFSPGLDGTSGATLFETEWTGLESNIIHSVFIDDTLQAYGTDGGAALHFSEYTKRDWQIYTTRDGLINDTVLSIVRDHSDNWWFGTIRGISRLSGSGWTSFTIESHSIISNQVKFLAVDPDGAIWMATDEGLSKFVNDQWISYPK